MNPSIRKIIDAKLPSIWRHLGAPLTILNDEHPDRFGLHWIINKNDNWRIYSVNGKIRPNMVKQRKSFKAHILIFCIGADVKTAKEALMPMTERLGLLETEKLIEYSEYDKLQEARKKNLKSQRPARDYKNLKLQSGGLVRVSWAISFDTDSGMTFCEFETLGRDFLRKKAHSTVGTNSDAKTTNTRLLDQVASAL